MAELNPLTRKQQEIYDFISRKIETHGYPPTIRDKENPTSRARKSCCAGIRPFLCVKAWKKLSKTSASA